MNTFRTTMAEYGYQTKTTFWEDFTIADMFGLSAIEDTYKRSMRDWHKHYIYLTELVMVLNHKMWYYYDEGNYAKYKTYLGLYEKAAQWAEDNLKGEELEYYFKTTD